MGHQLLGWTEASNVCHAAGAHLVSVESSDEWAFLAPKVNTGVWLGATDTSSEGDFVWSDGQPVRFAAFADGQPDDPGGSQNCLVAADDGFWSDAPCADLHELICEIDD